MECTLSRDRFDLCGRKLLFFRDYGQSFPENIEQLERGDCRLINESVNCINQYADNCIKKFSRTLIKSLVLNTSNVASLRCSTGSKSYIEMAKCLNQVWLSSI